MEQWARGWMAASCCLWDVWAEGSKREPSVNDELSEAIFSIVARNPPMRCCCSPWAWVLKTARGVTSRNLLPMGTASAHVR